MSDFEPTVSTFALTAFQSGVGAVGSGLGAVGGAVGSVVPGLSHHDLSADALKAREAAVQSREDACKVN